MKTSIPWGPECWGLNILDPRHSQIDMLDISAALQGIRRWCGRGPTTVAQHSLALANRYEEEEHQLYALLHDLPEAYLGDFPRPFKGQIPGLERIHTSILVQAYVHLGVPVPPLDVRQVVHDGDDDLNLIEASSPHTQSTGALYDGSQWLVGVKSLVDGIRRGLDT